MDIYDSRYFLINKKLLSIFGLWPYDSNSKYFRRTLALVTSIVLLIPQIISIKVAYPDRGKQMLHVLYTVILMMVFFKLFTLTLAQEKLQLMFKNIADNWQMITDEDEKNILRRYSEYGRFISNCYMILLLVGSMFFVLLPVIPMIINKINPESEPLPPLYILDGEYLIEDKDAHYFKIYLWEVLSQASIIVVTTTTDITYASCTQHCVGLFAIVRHRLRMPGRLDPTDDTSDPCDWIVGIIKLHTRSFELVKSLEIAYSTCLFVIIIITIIIIPISCVMVIFNLHNPIALIRYCGVCPCLFVHAFFYSWLGQQIIDYSSNIFRDAYCNEWYASSRSAKVLLRIVMIRSLKPCAVSAGGLIDMNMENFYAMMKTAVSYITVCASFQK